MPGAEPSPGLLQSRPTLVPESPARPGPSRCSALTPTPPRAGSTPLHSASICLHLDPGGHPPRPAEEGSPGRLGHFWVEGALVGTVLDICGGWPAGERPRPAGRQHLSFPGCCPCPPPLERLTRRWPRVSLQAAWLSQMRVQQGRPRPQACPREAGTTGGGTGKAWGAEAASASPSAPSECGQGWECAPLGSRVGTLGPAGPGQLPPCGSRPL